MDIAFGVLGVVVTGWVWLTMRDLLGKVIPLMALLSASLLALALSAAVTGNAAISALVSLLGFVSFSFQMIVFAYGLIRRRQSKR